MKSRLVTYDAAQQHYGTWLLGYEWQIYGTGTYRRRVSAEGAQVLFRRYMERLARKLRHPRTDIGYVAYLEHRSGHPSGLGKPPVHYHWHFLAASRTGVSLQTEAETLWTKMFGNAEIREYDAASPAAYYVCKSVGEPNGIGVIEHLDGLTYRGPQDLLTAAQHDAYVPEDLKWKTHGKFLTVRSCM